MTAAPVAPEALEPNPPPTPVAALTAALRDLAERRRIDAKLRGAVQAALGEWELSQQVLLADAERAAQELAAAEATAREAAVAAHQATGQTRPAPGVVMKLATTYEYDEEQALEHCREHQTGALKLDRKVFEKMCGVVTPNFVVVRGVYRPTIATDLDAALGGA